MQLDDPFDDRKSEARPAFFARGGTIGLLKLIKNSCLICGRDPWTCVDNTHFEPVIVEDDVYPDLAAVGELDGIADEIQQHLFESSFIPCHRR